MAYYPSLIQEPSIDTDKLSYEIFSILESKFLFGYDDNKVWPTPPKEEASGERTGESKGEGILSPVLSPKAEAAVSAASHKTDTAASSTLKTQNQRGKVCILSIDGGGMRGILSGRALAYLEQALKSKSGNPEARIADYFDVAAGSGIGGIFTAMLFASKEGGRPIFKANDTWRFLAENGQKFFRPSPSSSSTSPKSSSSSSGFFKWFSKSRNPRPGRYVTGTAGMEREMKEKFASLTLKDTIKPVLIPCYDLSSSAPFLFSRADALESESFNFRLWEVCRATSAEPVMFDPVEMSSTDDKTRCVAIDGGLAMSNPTAAAITHVLHNKQEFPFVRGVEDVMVLSLGSGQLFEGSCGVDQVKGWKAKDWARPMARIAGDGAADLVDQSVSMAFGQCSSSNYVRIQANGSKLCKGATNVDHDPSPSNVKMLLEVSEEMMKQKNVESALFSGKRIGEQTNFEKLDWFAGELVSEHQKRSCRIAPTVAFKQATPKST